MADVKIISTPTSRERIAPQTSKTAERKLTDKQTLDRAVAAMDSVYGIASTIILLLGLDDTRQAWEDRLPALRENNREALAASPALAATLAKTGDSLGSSAFVVGHVMAIAPVVKIARTELAERRAAKRGSDAAWDEQPAPATD